MIGYAEARETVRQHSTPLPTDSVALDAARGRVLSRALIAPESLPPFDNTAMDGYALQVPASGLPAGAVAYFLSFDHDTDQFEIVSSATVSADASTNVPSP